MPEITQDRITVEHKDRKYFFRIPSIAYDVEVGYRAADIRRRYDPLGRGALDSLDWNAVQFAHHAALFELYLAEAEEQWPWSAGKDGKPVVDHAKWPGNRATAVREIGEAFLAEFARFRQSGDGNEERPREEGVVGVGSPGESG